jgi:hypothetical protein
MFENIFKGNAYYRSPCIYLLIYFEYIPKVLNPGKRVSILKINELALEEE